MSKTPFGTGRILIRFHGSSAELRSINISGDHSTLSETLVLVLILKFTDPRSRDDDKDEDDLVAACAALRLSRDSRR